MKKPFTTQGTASLALGSGGFTRSLTGASVRGYLETCILFAVAILGGTLAPAQELPPQRLFSGPRVGHYSYAYDRSHSPLHVAVELQFKKPGGGTSVLLAGAHVISGTNRVQFPTSGTYEFVLHEVWNSIDWEGVHTVHSYTVISTVNVDNQVPQPIVGAPSWDESFESEKVSEVDVTLTANRTLTLTDVAVLGGVRVGGTGTNVLYGTLDMTGGDVHSKLGSHLNIQQLACLRC